MGRFYECKRFKVLDLNLLLTTKELIFILPIPKLFAIRFLLTFVIIRNEEMICFANFDSEIYSNYLRAEIYCLRLAIYLAISQL